MLKEISLKNNKEFQKLFSVVVDQVFMSIATLLTTVVLARTYSKTNYADLVLLFSITVFILGFQSAIISKPYTINLNDFKEEERKVYFSFNLQLKLCFTVLVALVFPLLYYFLFDIWDLKKVIAFTVYIVANISYYFIRETFLGERKTKQNLVYGILCSFGLLILLAFIFFIKKISIYNYLWIASSIYGSLILIFLFNYFKNGVFSVHRYWFFASLNWKIGRWLVGSNILFFLSSSIYPWLLLYITNKEDIAVYGVLVSVSSIVNPLLSALSSYMLPLFVRNNTHFKNINLMVKKWTLLFGALSLALCIIGYFFGQSIIDVLFGEKYKNLGVLVIYPFAIQAINVLFQPIRISLNAIKRTDINFWVLIPRSTVALVLGYFFINKYGLAGAFYTMFVENTIYQLLNLLIFRDIIKNRTKTHRS